MSGRASGSRLAVAAALGAAVAVAASPAPEGSVAGPPPRPPNVVIVQTDDQSLDSMRVMERTNALLGRRGATFLNHFVNLAVCCPSRATLLTGQYAHNHGVWTNSPPDGGYQAFDNQHTLATWLGARGYVTAHVGKFLNGYGDEDPAEVPPGWDEWYAGTAGTTQRVYDYTENENGQLVDHGSARRDFKQDLYTRRAVQLVREHAGTPIYLQLDYTAPHQGGPNPLPHPPGTRCADSGLPAPRHADAFRGIRPPRPPSFDEADVSDKPRAIRDLPRLGAAGRRKIARLYRCRLESLLSVDEGVARLVRVLRKLGELRRTYVIFTSDNGFFLGEHRIPMGKGRVYEPSVRVPLLIRGPGIEPGTRVRELTINADLAPTVVAASGAEPTLEPDGRSLLPLIARPRAERGRELLIEGRGYVALRNQRFLYARYGTGEEELYDLWRDPFELASRHAAPRYSGRLDTLRERATALAACAGATCRATPALALELRRGHAQPGARRCSRRVRVRVAGADLASVAELSVVRRGRTTARDRSAPFVLGLGRSELGALGRVGLVLRATLADGRRLSSPRTVHVCAPG